MIKSRYAIILCLLVSVSMGLGAQEHLRVKKSEFITSKEGGSVALQKIKKADQQIAKGKGYWPQALNLYLEAAEYNSQNAVLNYRIGVCYLIGSPKLKALTYLKKSFLLDSKVSWDIHFLLGEAYHKTNDVLNATKEFKLCMRQLELLSEKELTSEKKELLDMCLKRLQECRSAEKLMKYDSPVCVATLEGPINTPSDEFYPFLVSDTKLVFSSCRDEDSKARRNPETGRFYQKVFSVDSTKKGWGNLKALDKKINGPGNAGIRGMVNDDEWIVCRGWEGDGDLSMQRRTKDGWSNASRIRGVNKWRFHETSASFTSDGKVMYFVSNRKGGIGSNDVWVTSRNNEGEWSQPQNMGSKVNTIYDEVDVFVSGDGNTLFFSSNGHNTMGGTDIFKCTRDENGNWGEPVNMGVPVNSTSDEISFFQKPGSKQFFLASDRDGGKGGFDIYYSFKKNIPSKAEEVAIASENVKVGAPSRVEKIERIALIPQKREEKAADNYFYSVQIGAAHGEMTTRELYRKYKGGDVIEHLLWKEWHCYTIGKFKTYQEAAKLRDSSGVPDAFVVMYKGEERVKVVK